MAAYKKGDKMKDKDTDTLLHLIAARLEAEDWDFIERLASLLHLAYEHSTEAQKSKADEIKNRFDSFSHGCWTAKVWPNKPDKCPRCGKVMLGKNFKIVHIDFSPAYLSMICRNCDFWHIIDTEGNRFNVEPY
jgi:hypothetical protein